MSLLVVLAALAVVASLPLFVVSLTAGRSMSQRVTRNLSMGLPVTGDLRSMVLSRPARERAFDPVVRALAAKGRRFTPAGVVRSAERRLLLAGEPWSIERFLATKLVVAVSVSAVTVARAFAAPSTSSVLLVPTAVIMAVLLPDVVLARRARARQTQILQDLPDTLDQLTVCVEAGLGFDAALARMAASNAGPVGQEIGRALQDIQIGIPRREALEAMLERTDVPELRQFVHAVGQAETYGVPVAGVLRSQALEQRQKRSARAEERAQKMPVKLVFPLVFCILPALFVVIIGPAAMRLARSFL